MVCRKKGNKNHLILDWNENWNWKLLVLFYSINHNNQNRQKKIKLNKQPWRREWRESCGKKERNRRKRRSGLWSGRSRLSPQLRRTARTLGGAHRRSRLLLNRRRIPLPSPPTEEEGFRFPFGLSLPCMNLINLLFFFLFH